MKLLIKQRVFSWTDSYDVYDEDGDAKYFVKAEFLHWGISCMYMTVIRMRSVWSKRS